MSLGLPLCLHWLAGTVCLWDRVRGMGSRPAQHAVIDLGCLQLLLVVCPSLCGLLYMI